MNEDTPEEEALLFLLLQRCRRRQKRKTKRWKPRFCVRDIFRQREQYGEYSRLVWDVKPEKKKRCYFFCYKDVVEDKNVRQSVESQDFVLETFSVKGSNMENIAD